MYADTQMHAQEHACALTLWPSVGGNGHRRGRVRHIGDCTQETVSLHINGVNQFSSFAPGRFHEGTWGAGAACWRAGRVCWSGGVHCTHTHIRLPQLGWALLLHAQHPA